MKRLVMLCLVFGATACADTTAVNDANDATNSIDTVAAADTQPLPEPTLPDLPEGWSYIDTGGDTVCSRGTPYFFAIKKGTVNKVIIDFMGGGACWNDQTCGFAHAIFNEDISYLKEIGDVALGGYYNQERDDNPFKGWYHVFVPYCTGDIHWGNSVVTYGEGADAFTINHKGAVNTRAVLDWVYGNFGRPEQVFVTGCSAGAYGAIGWAPDVIKNYPHSEVYQMGDSGVGVITDSFFKKSFPVWNAWEILPKWIDGLDLTQEELFELSLHDLYGRIANHYSDRVFSQYNSAFDQTQVFYYQAMGGGTLEEWSKQMFDSVANAEDQADNFKGYIAPGDMHCILPYDEFYSVKSGDVRLVDWLSDMLEGKSISNIKCSDCDAPEE